MKEGSFRIGIRKKFLTLRVMRHWHSLSREALGAPFLEEFLDSLDGDLSDQLRWGWCKVSLPLMPMAGWLETENL